MATYMYTSATGSNWDDDDDDFDVDTYKATADFSAPTIDDLGPLQRAPAVAEEEEYEVKQSTAPPAPRKSTVDYDSIPSYQWPSPARATAELWTKDEHRRPAYVEMSHEGGHAYPDQRRSYNTNWLCTKVNMCCSMKVPTMMKPSPLQQSMTWEEDSAGEYIKEAGLLSLSMLSPSLSQDSYSEEGQDEPFTPPGSPSMAMDGEWRDKVEEYNSVTTAIEIPANNEENDGLEIPREFVDFNHTSDTLDIEDILGDAARNMQHPYHSQASSLESYTPPGSLDLRNANEEETSDTPTATSTIVEDGRIRRDPVVDLMTVDAMAHSLIAIVKATQSAREIGDVNTEDIIKKTPVAVPSAESRIGDGVVNVHNQASEVIGFVEAAQATVDVSTIAVEAIHVIALDTECRTNDIVDDYNQLQDDNDGLEYTLEDSTPLVKNASLSPDLKYIHNPANTSLVWNTVAASWFALSSLPWGRIAVAAAGALVDAVTFVARH